MSSHWDAFTGEVRVVPAFDLEGFHDTLYTVLVGRTGVGRNDRRLVLMHTPDEAEAYAWCERFRRGGRVRERLMREREDAQRWPMRMADWRKEYYS